VLTDLGTVDGDPSSAAFVVNSGRQVVGATQDANFAYVHAFLWERGSIADLNALIPVNSGVQLMAAVGLNERGEIVAQGVLSNGDVHAFILIPCDENHADVEGCDYSEVEVTTEAPVRSTTTTTSAGKLSAAEMMMRYRFLVANRYRSFVALPLK
jgi:probable HAF family extracellular repeat protein